MGHFKRFFYFYKTFANYLLQNNEMLSKEDRILMKVLTVEIGHGAKKIKTEFAMKNWAIAFINCLLLVIKLA